MPKGYTLIELLVVLAIMSILGTIAFINFKTFSQDQVLNKALGEMQSFLRLAQSNATSSVKCGNISGASWAVKFLVDKININLACGPTDSVQKTLTLENTQVTSIQCSPADSTCPPTGSTFNPPLTISYSPLYGNVTFSQGDLCVANASTLMIVLKNLLNNKFKCFTISKGGAIDIK